MVCPFDCPFVCPSVCLSRFFNRSWLGQMKSEFPKTSWIGPDWSSAPSKMLVNKYMHAHMHTKPKPARDFQMSLAAILKLLLTEN